MPPRAAAAAGATQPSAKSQWARAREWLVLVALIAFGALTVASVIVGAFFGATMGTGALVQLNALIDGEVLPAPIALFAHPRKHVYGQDYAYVHDVRQVYAGVQRTDWLNVARSRSMCDELVRSVPVQTLGADVPSAMSTDHANVLAVFNFTSEQTPPRGASFIIERATGLIANALLITELTVESTQGTAHARTYIGTTQAYIGLLRANSPLPTVYPSPRTTDFTACVRQVRVETAQWALSGPLTQAVADAILAEDFVGA